MTFDQTNKKLNAVAGQNRAQDEARLCSELFDNMGHTARASEFYAGLEAAAIVADHAGIKDVNIDCRSGARIADKIRTFSKNSGHSENWDMATLMALKAARDAAFAVRYDSTQNWTGYVSAKTAYEEASTQFLDAVFDHY